MSTAPAEVAALVERFGRNLSDYKGGAYNETQVRREFIDPLFKALGWDVDNEQGYAEAYKDVIHEDAIKVGGATKAPDYCFRIGGVRKFFLEAKRPAVPLKEHAESAFQLRRYAWSARLPLSILTDFEELAVYDCRSALHPKAPANCSQPQPTLDNRQRTLDNERVRVLNRCHAGLRRGNRRSRPLTGFGGHSRQLGSARNPNGRAHFGSAGRALERRTHVASR